MNSQVNFAEEFKPSFSGHETFPLRHGWLEKSYQAIVSGDKNPFSADDAIAEFGVGKNMVSSIKHWAMATGFIEFSEENLVPSYYAKALLGEQKVDPYLEHADSIWKIHYELTKNPKNTTFHWLFCHFNENIFDKTLVTSRILNFLHSHDLKIPAEKTLLSDINVSLATYCSNVKNSVREDDVSSPLGELKLIRSTDDARHTFNFGPKNSLSDELLLSCLVDYWESESSRLNQNINSLKFEKILHEARSPGRIFLLSEKELAARFANIEEISEGGITWSETAGIQLLAKTQHFDPKLLLNKWLKKR